MIRNVTAWALALAVALNAACPIARAHQLQTATAQVTLRPGQVSVAAHVDLLALLTAVHAQQPGAEPIPVGVLSVVDPPAFDMLVSSAYRTLTEQTSLTVNGTQVSTDRWQLPTPEQLRGIAQKAAMATAVDEHTHTTLTQVRFEAMVPQAKTVSLSLPAQVGPVVISFVQPFTQTVAAGQKATYHPQVRALAPQ